MRRSLAFGLLLLVSCSARTQLPIVQQEVDLSIPTQHLVCHVRNIAEAQRLSFHYGTFEPSKVTFRLIGDGFELVAYNPERAHTYLLQAYDMSPDGKGRAPAEHAFAAFRTALLEPVSPACAHSN
jgi:hypothetical protein